MPTSALPPLAFAPLPIDRPWGGSRAATYLGIVPPAGRGPIGEWWLVSARASQPSRVVGGPLAGKTLPELLEHDGAALLGAHGAAGRQRRFPLLLKLLDTSAPLSVQVHPSDAAQPGEGKTESWYIVEATADATFWLGLVPGAKPADVFAAARSGRSPESFLARHQAARGLLAHLPPGTLHALGAGIVAVEFQSNADTTWRIWDWERKPARELHLAQAERDTALDQTPHLLSAAPDRTRTPPCDRLVDCDAYRVERLEISAPTHLTTDGDRCEILLSLGSALRVRNEAGSTEVPRGHAFLLPATSGDYVVTPEARAELLRFLPAPAATGRGST